MDRGVEVDHVTVDRWVQRFTPPLADAARFARHSPGDGWFVDETYVRVNGIWRYVYRAIDQDGQVIDVLVSARRDAATARRFFHRALTMLKVTPSEVVTDAAPIYPAVLEELMPAGVASRRTAREQSDRGRPQSAQTPAQTDARTSNRPNRAGDHRRDRTSAAAEHEPEPTARPAPATTHAADRPDDAAQRPRGAAPSTRRPSRTRPAPLAATNQHPNCAQVQQPNNHAADPAVKPQKACSRPVQPVLARYKQGWSVTAGRGWRAAYSVAEWISRTIATAQWAWCSSC